MVAEPGNTAFPGNPTGASTAMTVCAGRDPVLSGSYSGGSSTPTCEVMRP